MTPKQLGKLAAKRKAVASNSSSTPPSTGTPSGATSSSALVPSSSAGRKSATSALPMGEVSNTEETEEPDDDEIEEPGEDKDEVDGEDADEEDEEDEDEEDEDEDDEDIDVDNILLSDKASERLAQLLGLSPNISKPKVIQALREFKAELRKQGGGCTRHGITTEKLTIERAFTKILTLSGGTFWKGWLDQKVKLLREELIDDPDLGAATKELRCAMRRGAGGTGDICSQAATQRQQEADAASAFHRAHLEFAQGEFAGCSPQNFVRMLLWNAMVRRAVPHGWFRMHVPCTRTNLHSSSQLCLRPPPTHSLSLLAATAPPACIVTRTPDGRCDHGVCQGRCLPFRIALLVADSSPRVGDTGRARSSRLHLPLRRREAQRRLEQHLRRRRRVHWRVGRHRLARLR